MAKAKKKAARKSAKATKKRAEKVAQRSKGTCFVMMPFSDPFNRYYTTIYRPAIEAAGLEPGRTDDIFRPSGIVSDLWSMIQEAKVLVAELTTKNANVFYELGLAHAIGKPVVMVSQTESDVPYDLQSLRVLLYNKDDPDWGAKLKKAMTSSIRETLDSPIEAVPNIFRKTVESQSPEQDAITAKLNAMQSQIRRLEREKPIAGPPTDWPTFEVDPDKPIGKDYWRYILNLIEPK